MTPRQRAGLVACLAVAGVLVAWAPFWRPFRLHWAQSIAGSITPDARRYLAAALDGSPDPLVAYQLALYPAGARGIVRTAVALGVDEARGLGHLLFLVALAGVALTAGAVGGTGAAWGAGLLFVVCGGRVIAAHTGAAPWAFALPALALFAAPFAAGRLRLALAALVVIAGLAPILAVPAALALGHVAWRGTPRRRGVALAALGIALAGALSFPLSLDRWGAPLAADAPEAGARGAGGGLPSIQLDDAALAELDGFRRWGAPLLRGAAAIPPQVGWSVVVVLIVAGALAAGREESGRRLLLLLGCVAVAALLLRPLRPYLDPTRQSPVLPLFFFGCVFLPVAGTWLARARLSRIGPTAGVAALLALLVGGRGDSGTGFDRTRDPAEVTASIALLPHGAVVAAPPHQVDDELVLAGRRPYLWEAAMPPFHEGYAALIREREGRLVAATFAAPEAGWGALLALRADGATHLIVDRDVYQQPNLGAPAPFDAWWRAARRAGSSWLIGLSQRGRVPLITRTHGAYAIVDLANAEAGRWLRDFAHPAPPVSLDAWRLRAESLRRTLLALAELPLPGRPTGRLLGRRVVDGVVIEDLLVDGWNGLAIPVTLYLPEKATGPVPAVCLFSGHDRAARTAPYVRQLAWRLARNGVAALTLDWLGMGTRWTDDFVRHVSLGARLVATGIAPVTPLVGEPLRVFDYLTTRPDIDSTRIAVAGQSGGGFVAMHLAALEPRVAAAVVVDIVVTNDYIRDLGWGDPDSFFPWSLRLTDHGEVLGLIAPRPLLVLSGRTDPVAPTDVGEQALATTRAIYALYGAQPAHVSTTESHTWSDAKLVHTLRFLGETLVGHPIDDRAAPPAGTEPSGAPPPGEPPWWSFAVARIAPSDAVPADEAAWARWAEVRRAALRNRIGPTARPALAPPVAPGDTVLWIADEGPPPAILGAFGRVVHLVPPGMGPVIGWAVHDRLHLWQDAVARGGSLLGVALPRLVAEAEAARRGGARRVIAACVGRQAAILCATAAALEHPFDAMVLDAYPPDFREIFFFREQPDLYYTTPGLFAAASSEAIVALCAPARVYLVGVATAPWTLARAAFAHDGGSLETAPDLVTALTWAKAALR